MHRGIRQGDPASGYLFSLAMQPLTNQILYSQNVRGILMNSDTEVRFSQYADDLIIFSRAEREPITGVLRELDAFSQVSGLHINIEKTKCLQIGRQVDTEFLTNLRLNTVSELKVLGIIYNNANDNIETRNLVDIIPKITQEIAQWNRRSLTIIGKITVVKTLLVSKMVHVFSALPNPPKDLIMKISKILFRFIWRNGPDKIKRHKLVQNYDRGGLKMLELNSFIDSLKVTWMKRLYWAEQDVVWAHTVREKIGPIDDLACFGAIKMRDIVKNKVENRFWRDVFNAWADFSEAYHVTDSQLLTEKIWFSDRTKFRKTIVKEWNNKGLRFIADLYCKKTGKMYNKSTLCKIFNIKMTFLCHSSLKKSISVNSQIGESTVRISQPIQPYKIALLARKSCISRIAYSEFIAVLNKRSANNSDQSPSERKWRRDIGCMHEGTMEDMRRSTKNTYLQAFHYRIVSRIIATNTFLYRIGKSETSQCSFCKSCDETLCHVLWECPIVQSFIKDVVALLNEKCNILVQFTNESWFFPRLLEESRINILIITIAKLTIYKSKCKENIPNIQHFLSRLKMEAQTEEESA